MLSIILSTVVSAAGYLSMATPLLPQAPGVRQSIATDSTLDSLTASHVAGCYDLSRTAWYRLPPVRVNHVTWPDSLLSSGDSALQFGHQHEPPRHVRMLLEPGPFDAGTQWHRLEPQGPDTLALGRFGMRGWRVRDASVIAFWSTGFVGVRLNLLVTDFGMEGTAVATSDVIGPAPIPAARVTLLRARCRD